ncbi:MAG: hypothetical protein V3T00_05720, partial [bacterium]
QDLETGDLEQLNAHFQRMDREARETLASEGFKPEDMELQHLVDLRYPGQTSEISVPVRLGPVTREVAHQLEAAFHGEHENSFGHRSEEGEKVEFVNLRLRARGLSKHPLMPSAILPAEKQDGGATAGIPRSRQAYFGKRHGWIETPVVRRGQLEHKPRPGPLIVEEYDTTVVAPPGTSLAADESNNIHITLDLQT